MKIHGSRAALANRLHRSQGWVSQRLALLNLTPELQARIGEDPSNCCEQWATSRPPSRKQPSRNSRTNEPVRKHRSRSAARRSRERTPRQQGRTLTGWTAITR
ncbi:hypothetical protein [Streptomyces sp. NPDC054804]